jgi:hypothetical protein
VREHLIFKAAVRWISLLVLFILTAAGVSARPQNKSVPFPVDPPDIHPRYFPVGVFQDSSDTGWYRGFKERWYAKHLRSMNEPSLSVASKDAALVAYRFVWLRTFHHPIVVRLTIQADGTGMLNAKETDGQGGYRAGRLFRNDAAEIARSQVSQFLNLLRKAAFWSLATEETSGGLDGAQWILEGVEKGHYHVVDRWSPKNGDYRSLCLYLLELSKLKVETNEVY